LLRSVSMLSCLIACTEPTRPQPADDTTVDTTVDTEPTTEALLEAFYADSGGREAFPEHYVEALEALLYGEDELEAGQPDAARARLDALFAELPLSTSVWREEVTFDSHNVGDPIAYAGLRMLDQILSFDEDVRPETLQLTAVVATCATVTRPTLPDLDPETVTLQLAPEILADDARVLRVASRLFLRWMQAITGLDVALVVHEQEVCAMIDYTDDGSVIVSYPDAAAMIGAVPAELGAETDAWWVVAPSGVPGDGSGYGRHFITGGMGAYGMGLPLLLSDDAWFTRKPEHLGNGAYSEVELRAYQPQWFQHEFMHHLFRTWPELGLEETGHQWFDRSSWPEDFEGIYEPDYYAEAVSRRLLDVEPSLAEGLLVPELADLSVQAGLLPGSYLREPILNEWHEVTVVDDAGGLRWSNAAGVSWSLEVRDAELWAGTDCPYGEQMIPVVLDGDVVDALWFGGERYGRVD
jgi:hypothetical protein